MLLAQPEALRTLMLPVVEERLVLRVVRPPEETEQADLAVALDGAAEVVEETTQEPEGLAEKVVLQRLAAAEVVVA
jgi:hypothetical protein